MFRRIELIQELAIDSYHHVVRVLEQQGALSEEYLRMIRYQKSGLMAVGNDTVAQAWDRMPIPQRSINRNCRFYFTEVGWRQYGRPTVAACQATGQRYRVLRIKENAVDVVYRDTVQVAVRPKKQRPIRRLRDDKA